MKITSCFVWLLPAMLAQFILVNASAQSGKTGNSISIVYEISVTKNKHAGGLEETYNGGTKSLFINRNKARIRLVSLMRIQSIFFDHEKETIKKVTVIKESGKKKYLFRLSPAEWKLYNKKYDSLVCDTSFTDSLVIAGYRCRKAVLTLEDNRSVTVYYTDSIRFNYFAEPLFRYLPGTALQYEFHTKKGFVQFKAATVSDQNIAGDIFKIPSKGAQVRKFYPGKKSKAYEEETTEEVDQ